ncbi:RNA polymerase sigma factor RpoD/SigA [bacterium]|nr:RNA polymerase sigma factor RpoD/SigA [bacterium]MBU1065489.1 RNA polymerase sigma factor RpoD/SigA [bacterium]MBU1873136.1 RNA polymerase sigma factor RpoD/SigA [bacterium]
MKKSGSLDKYPHSHSHVLKRYFEEISHEDPLTPEEEIELAAKVRQGDSQALDKLLRANLRFVVSVAKKYQNHGLSLEDLINEGNIGLIKAAQRFDETRGFKFISYAVWWIRQTILQAISEYSRLVRLPLNVVGNLNKISKITSEFEQEYEREPTTEEIEEILAQEKIDLDVLRQLSEGTLSIDSPIGKNGSGTLQDILRGQEENEPGNLLTEESFHIEVERALRSLDDRESTIIRMYFGIGHELPMTLEEIGNYLHLTRERVRQIKEKALRKLRHTSRALNLRGFLG